MWDLARRIRTEDIAAGKNPLSSVRFRRDGKVLASADYCGRITLWNAATFAKVAESSASAGELCAMCYSPDGKVIAAGSGSDILLLDSATMKTLRTLRGSSDSIQSVGFSPDGRVLASGGWDEDVRLWEVASGKCAAATPVRHRGVLSVSFSADGRSLACGNQDGTITLFDARNGKQIASFQAARGQLRCLQFGVWRRPLGVRKRRRYDQAMGPRNAKGSPDISRSYHVSHVAGVPSGW